MLKESEIDPRSSGGSGMMAPAAAEDVTFDALAADVRSC